jgi:hypothetical protein
MDEGTAITSECVLQTARQVALWQYGGRDGRADTLAHHPAARLGRWLRQNIGAWPRPQPRPRAWPQPRPWPQSRLGHLK